MREINQKFRYLLSMPATISDKPPSSEERKEKERKER